MIFLEKWNFTILNFIYISNILILCQEINIFKSFSRDCILFSLETYHYLYFCIDCFMHFFLFPVFVALLSISVFLYVFVSWYYYNSLNACFTWRKQNVWEFHHLDNWQQGINGLYEAGYAISLIALLLSLGILTYFRSLRCARITLHMNLFASFAVNNALWLVWYRCIVANTDLLLNNGVCMKILTLCLTLDPVTRTRI